MLKPLKVALIVKGSPASLERSNRNMGYWSYPVPEFEWTHHVIGDMAVAKNKFAGCDLIFMDDIGTNGSLVGGGPPVVYLSIDSTLSSDHRAARLRHAQRADLVLVDHDRLETFKATGRPVRRWSYCVNDRVFLPLEKSLDVCYHCASGEHKGMPGGKERNVIRARLGELCRVHGLSFVSGGVGLDEYARHMGQARVVVNWPRTVSNRPHRVLDAMACRAALLTGPIPVVAEDYLEWGRHYVDYTNLDEMERTLAALLDSGSWEEHANAGYQLVVARHTWATRASELRQMLREELGL